MPRQSTVPLAAAVDCTPRQLILDDAFFVLGLVEKREALVGSSSIAATSRAQASRGSRRGWSWSTTWSRDGTPAHSRHSRYVKTILIAVSVSTAAQRARSSIYVISNGYGLNTER